MENQTDLALTSSEPTDAFSKRDVYIFIGPEKTGTTTMNELLPFATHDRQKERFNLSRKKDLKAELRRIQSQKQPQAFIVEPTYFYSQNAADLAKFLTDLYNVHIVHTRRSPLARSISHYLHHLHKGRVKNVYEAVEKFPEIVTASQYDRFTPLWENGFHSFRTIELEQLEHGFSPELIDIGITTTRREKKSNKRLAPRNRATAQLMTTIWDTMIALRINTFVPSSTKKIAKDLVYKGGNEASLSEEEKGYLEQCIQTTC